MQSCVCVCMFMINSGNSRQSQPFLIKGAKRYTCLPIFFCSCQKISGLGQQVLEMFTSSPFSPFPDSNFRSCSFRLMATLYPQKNTTFVCPFFLVPLGF